MKQLTAIDCSHRTGDLSAPTDFNLYWKKTAKKLNELIFMKCQNVLVVSHLASRCFSSSHFLNQTENKINRNSKIEWRPCNMVLRLGACLDSS